MIVSRRETTRGSLRNKLRRSLVNAEQNLPLLRDRLSRLHHDYPIEKAAEIAALEATICRLELVKVVTVGLAESWQQKQPGKNAPFYSFRSRNGLNAGAGRVLTLKQLLKQTVPVLCKEWMFPVDKAKEAKPSVGCVKSSDILLAKCQRCGEYQPVVSRRKPGEGVFGKRITHHKHFLVCLNCDLVCPIHSENTVEVEA